MLAEKLAELELETLTPSLIGGYDTGSYSYALGPNFYEGPRALAIKGCLRWWLRALLAGALWEAGKKVPEIEEQAGKKVGRIFGTAHPPEDSCASRILLRVRPRELNPLSELSDQIPRLRLLIQGVRERKRWRLSCFPERLKFNLSLYLKSELTGEEKEVVRWATLLYSIFGGVGAVTRRGFGALRIIKGEVDGPSFKEILNKLSYSDINVDLIKNIVSKALNSAHQLFRTSAVARDEIPPFPVITESNRFLKIEVMEVQANDSLSLLTILGNCTLKSSWRRTRGEGYDHDTWVLGLPRKSKIRGVITGYEVKDKCQRRASSIILKPIARSGSMWKILVYGFLSKDWPKRIIHRSVRPDRKGRTLERAVKKPIESAFEEAWNKILNLLRQRA